ncbi:transcriptional activator of sulfur metabolism [Kluyveromyces marxianus DMKU3-1042]|uniref:Transcriptional activator of sulfur metabolism n=1 Tax=Kluyveromyces marxianus (strain DMKU3-1042 / BCC 29191 / NBRC 104275) TaxID=1003335 RepID=W0TEU8_KLUMD|nr:transcriptional activator of sulfur metabolism [Kluyveromyces marxianus DMKU3-1042]BAO42172.1 transcriptional activator of sulfur metabolism [Kluyveromyces marxianus DMKU3-1042]
MTVGMASAADKGHVLARNGEKTEEGKLDEILLRGLQSSSDEQAGTGSASGSTSTSTSANNYTVSKTGDSQRKVSVSVPSDETEGSSSSSSSRQADLSLQVRELINNNSELGSRLLSLLLVSSDNAKDIIEAVNRGDISKLRDLTEETTTTTTTTTTTKSETGTEPTDKVEPQPIKSETQTQPTKGPETAPQESAPSSARSVSPDNVDDPLWKQLEKRRKNTEASARFRIRKKQREKEKLEQLKQLTKDINAMYDTIDTLISENNYWKEKLQELNEIKSRELLDKIKKRSGL